MKDKIIEIVSQESNLPIDKVAKTVSLLDDQNTVPFIARYRKEATGGLDEVEIRTIEEQIKFHRNLEQRKLDIIRLIEEQGKLTDELKTDILKTDTISRLEDLYRPYRPKRKTRASVARDNGLEPLAQYLFSFPHDDKLNSIAEQYLNENVTSVEDAVNGALDIIAEQVADNATVRGFIRKLTLAKGILVTKAKDENNDTVYSMYYDYSEPVSKLPPHRILAINRGEREEIIKVSIEPPKEEILNRLYKDFLKPNTATTELVQKAIDDSFKRLIEPSVEREVRNELTEKAEAQAVVVFSKNLRGLLLQAPVGGKVVFGIDPAYRTGCKWAVINETGKLLKTGVFYPTPPQKKIAEAEKVLDEILDEYSVEAIVIGNGTASRETEQFVAEYIKKYNKEISYTIISEAGASVYSASEIAQVEFPNLDVAERSAVSIGRRVQDPLAELVKIEPRSIGVGQYQHDIVAKKLNENLSKVVESVVNYVGVELNTASPSLLTYVSGINSTVAKNIVNYREKEGKFKFRKDLLKVAKLGPKAYEQCAGFLRIDSAKNPLDNTAIHPESYDLTHKLLDYINSDITQLGSNSLKQKLNKLNVKEVAEKLEAGVPTLTDIIENLQRPGRDPRDELPKPIFRTDVLTIEDLKPGMILKGTVANVVDFGAFVDIGVKQSGLVHISEMSNKFIKHPLEVVTVGDIVDIAVISVDLKNERIALSMKNV
ncbi:Transcription accessory protein (S1 RNA-binding domain) [Candidatus Syntrophocurvum alkaliphilum]|uniref:Transcription accessory protein (S1 RNA-binding domain) n=1 Tax=Candidatus Syntrophocurvum alkaliphilum TaxID=2293317 RepID=A0A6I6D5R9_9FIRM|nr:Tex family protein [Candidatus Syntrophocurvum alkaliphilum]QGT98673.1 Transcription accessory protein (S1 RNA-binding domain) [Candidatus Syntrophocurvum alkaliphilum]